MTEPSEPRVFWADEVADTILASDPDEPIIIKGGISPSGVPHLGNANEIILGHFVAEVLRDRGYTVRQIFTTDDRDPLRNCHVDSRIWTANWSISGMSMRAPSVGILVFHTLTSPIRSAVVIPTGITLPP